MFGNILYGILAILILGVIVVFHEFGHYLVGRLTGIGVLEFSVGFGPKLFGFTKSGIDYSVRLVPLGGYCKFEGEDEANSSPTAFNNAKVWKRFLTVLAGPVLNGVLALLATVLLLAVNGRWDYAPVVGEVIEGMPAAEAGLMTDDMVLSINGIELTQDQAGMETMQSAIAGTQPGESVELIVNRGGETVELSVLPVYSEQDQRYQIGFYFGSVHYAYRASELLPEAWSYLKQITGLMLDSLRKLFFHGEGLNETMGPVGIISTVGSSVQEGFSQTAQQGFAVIFYMMAIISMNLGIMNLIPFPALDGGRLIFLIAEGLRGKPVPPEKEGMVHGLGFLLLLAFILFITYKDVLRMIIGG